MNGNGHINKIHKIFSKAEIPTMSQVMLEKYPKRVDSAQMEAFLHAHTQTHTHSNKQLSTDQTEKSLLIHGGSSKIWKESTL